MYLAVRQEADLANTNSEDWVSVERAAELTGESVWTWRRRARWEARRSQHRQDRCLAVKRPGRGAKGRTAWFVHRKMHPALTRFPGAQTREGRAYQSLRTRYSQTAIEDAYRKARWLREWRVACEGRRDPSVTEAGLAEGIIDKAKAVEGEDFAISLRSLQAWQRAYNRIGKHHQIVGVEGLIDRRAGINHFAEDKDGNGLPCGRDVRGVEYFHTLYWTEQKLSVRFCHELTLREAKRSGWTWPASYSATRKWLQATDNVAFSYLMRYGQDAWCRRFMPHIEIDYSLIAPGQMYQTDHHQCDFWVVERGKQLRPWLTVVEDMPSRTIVGWNLGVSPHQDAILTAYLEAFRGWGIPERLRIDNGRDFTSALLTGVGKTARDRLRREYGRDWHRIVRRAENLVECLDPRFTGITEELGIETVYAIPYAPWSKGITERFFGTFEERCGKTFATYCGRSALTKPTCLATIRRGYTKGQKQQLRKRYGSDWHKVAVLKLVDQGGVPTLDEAREAIGDWITEYHHTAHTGDGMAGRTPLEVWHTATRLRKAGDEELLFLMQTRGIYKVGPNGVAFTIGGHRLTYGAGNPALYRWTGREVLVTLDPNDVSCCYAFSPDRDNRQFIARLDANKRISPMASVDELREANANVGRRRKIMHKATRESPTRTRTAAEELAAKRREKARELRATGTDHAQPMIVPVPTGFEGPLDQVRSTAEGVKRDRKARDLRTAKAALGFGIGLSERPRRRQRASDDLLRFGQYRNTEATLTDDGDGNGKEGKDAGHKSTDLLKLIGGDIRHERRPE